METPRFKSLKEINLTNGGKTLVDDKDYPILAAHNWYRIDHGNTSYAARHTKRKQVLMHRQIMDLPQGVLVDHWDRNGLNNQRENLRPATHQQNRTNSAPSRGKSSKFKGVRRHRYNKWMTTIEVDGCRKYCGIWPSEEEAARVYDRFARRHFGEFAYLNFPDEQLSVAGQVTFATQTRI